MSEAMRLRLERAERRVELLEQLLGERNRDLAITQEQTSAVHTYLTGLNDVIPGAMICASADGVITRTNAGVQSLLGYSEFELSGEPLTRVWAGANAVLQAIVQQDGVVRSEAEWLGRNGEVVAVLLSAAAHRDQDGRLLSVVLVGLDVRDRRRLELELRHAQKLEALGQLSAGVAHEINTPMQFIGDNLSFIRDCLLDLKPLLDLVIEAPPVLRSLGAMELAERLEAAVDGADLEFAQPRMPRAVESALEGVTRVSRIVDAMKAFAAPQAEMSPTDLNRCLSDTLVVSRNEYKYVAEVEVELGDLPPVVCNGSDLNQVFLNLIVNAAHAIEARYRGTEHKGRIGVRTVMEGGHAHVEISDDGNGIPAQIQHRIFDPFFTTKEVGKGTGQGLAIARSIVVERHGGTLSFDTETGAGTTFHVRVPLSGPPRKEAA